MIHHCTMLFSYCATGPHIPAHTDDIGSIYRKMVSVSSIMYVYMCVGYILKIKNYVAQRAEYIKFKTGYCWSLHEYRSPWPFGNMTHPRSQQVLTYGYLYLTDTILQYHHCYVCPSILWYKWWRWLISLVWEYIHASAF